MEIRDLTSGDLDAVLDLRKRAFGPLPASNAETWRSMVEPVLPEGRFIGAFDGTRLVGTSRINHCTQWWHGRSMPMGGVASVTVAPEDRGRGVGRLIMRTTVERCAELGDVVSALYPATTPLYRGAGWEHAGGWFQATFPAEALRTLGAADPAVKLRRMGPDDAPELMAVLDRVYAAARTSGAMGWDERTWRLWLSDEDDFCYLAEDGYVIYRWSGSDMEVDNLVAGTEATARALWSLVGTASSIAKKVTASVEPTDPVFWLLRERTYDEVQQTRWMFRLIDLAEAVARRGYPAGVALDATVSVADPVRDANSGVWRLTAGSGSGTAERVGASSAAGLPELTIGGLSALYAGVSTATLRRSGLLKGGSLEVDDALDAAFAASPYMIDHF